MNLNKPIKNCKQSFSANDIRNDFVSHSEAAKITPSYRVTKFNEVRGLEGLEGKQNLVNLFLIKLVRVSGFSSLFSAIAVFFSTLWQNVLKILRSLGKEQRNKPNEKLKEGTLSDLMF